MVEKDDVEWLIAHSKRIAKYVKYMSYSDSYFGEPTGEVKEAAQDIIRITEKLEHQLKNSS